MDPRPLASRGQHLCQLSTGSCAAGGPEVHPGRAEQPGTGQASLLLANKEQLDDHAVGMCSLWRREDIACVS